MSNGAMTQKLEIIGLFQFDINMELNPCYEFPNLINAEKEIVDEQHSNV
jgi:hypothetical protein